MRASDADTSPSTLTQHEGPVHPSRRRELARPNRESSISTHDTYTYTPEDILKQDETDRFIEIYRATAAEQPVSVRDLEPLRIRLSQLDLRRARLPPWGILSVIVAAESVAASQSCNERTTSSAPPSTWT